MKKGLGIVGYGGMGVWHLEKAQKSDVVELIAVYDINEERNLVAEENGIKAYRSLDEILADEKVEIILIATPNDVHEEVVVAALNAGKSVICEKPVALSLESLDRMIAAAEKNGVRFSTHQNRRWDVRRNKAKFRTHIVQARASDISNLGNIYKSFKVGPLALSFI